MTARGRSRIHFSRNKMRDLNSWHITYALATLSTFPIRHDFIHFVVPRGTNFT